MSDAADDTADQSDGTPGAAAEEAAATATATSPIAVNSSLV